MANYIRFKIKTTYNVIGDYECTDTKTLYCYHDWKNDDYTVMYEENGKPATMHFYDWESGNNLWDAMIRLMDPFEDDGETLKPKVEFCENNKFPWE